jgi:hypothetical protein
MCACALKHFFFLRKASIPPPPPLAGQEEHPAPRPAGPTHVAHATRWPCSAGQVQSTSSPFDSGLRPGALGPTRKLFTADNLLDDVSGILFDSPTSVVVSLDDLSVTAPRGSAAEDCRVKNRQPLLPEPGDLTPQIPNYIAHFQSSAPLFLGNLRYELVIMSWSSSAVRVGHHRRCELVIIGGTSWSSSAVRVGHHRRSSSAV